MTKYQPITGVWEVTMGCNMRCKHCGSSCENALSDELTTDEALNLADQIADLGLKWITLSGGEPFTRKDWHLIAGRLQQKGVVPNIITNGWLVNEDIVKKAKEAKVGTIAISLDGLRDTHDFIRKPGSYERVMNALRMFIKNDIVCGVITTISNANFNELRELRQVLVDMKVPYWQVQIGLPMGNYSKQPEFALRPEQMDTIIEFCFETATQGEITIYPADCIGYYNVKELQTRQISHNVAAYPVWQGCNAGKRGFGILQNGDILGCTSIRDKQFVEGSIRNQSLREIWEDPNNFLWNRKAVKADLKADCSICKYGDECLGGCPNTRLTMEKNLHAENKFCSYNLSLKKSRQLLSKETDVVKLMEDAKRYVSQNEYQIAELVFSRLLELEPDNLEALKFHGFISFFLKNYSQAELSNRKALELEPTDAYSLKGLGITLCKSGKDNQGLDYLKKAVDLATPEFMDPYYDLALIYIESGRKPEAKELLDNAKRVSEAFYIQNQGLYQEVNS